MNRPMLFGLAVAILGGVVACSDIHKSGALPAPGTAAIANGAPAFVPQAISRTPPPAPRSLQPPPPRKTNSGRRLRSGTPAAFFNGEVALANGNYYLKFPNGNVFGYYHYDATPGWIYHNDLGWLYYQDANDGSSGIDFYDNTSGHWLYTSPTYSFPYLYDFYYATAVYYDPITPTPPPASTPNPAGGNYYTSNPRWFYNFKFAQQMKSPSTVAWQAGNSTSSWMPVQGNNQCGNPVASADILFTLKRSVNADGSYGGDCLRNQIEPQDSGHNFWLQLGASYTFTFETITTLNGNTAYRGGDGADLPGMVWQSHGENGHPCAVLEIQNTRFLNVSGLPSPYPNAEPTGQPVWSFSTCDYENEPAGSATSPSPVLPHAYNGTDVVAQGADDTWQIDVVPQLRLNSGGPNGGYIQVHRNGNIVFDNAASFCWDGESQCWWNFGPYMYHWNSPPTYYDPAGITVEFKNTTLYKNN